MQTPRPASATDSARIDGPYVGLRPFEASERELYYGRERDGRKLCDRILSSPVTLFYAQSGMGKTSLLRTLVAPELKSEGCRVIYFDAWTGEDPERSLKALFLDACRELGLPAPSDDPSLTELVRLLASADGLTQVLLLDQFEEFLIAHGQRLDPLRRELAALVRAPNLDVHVLIALREEFLAALEPFRGHMLGLFQSAYRLEAMDEAGAREAVVAPAAVFGRDVDPKLAERLLRDLRLGGSGDEKPTGDIDLPMLQLVCSQLWGQAEAQGEPQLSEALYDRVGGAAKILDAYVREVMPRRWRAKLFAARLMRPLAPPSGYKVSLSCDDLAELTGLRRDRIEAELARLTQRRILRVREFRSGPRFELQHDAFIRIIGPWRDMVLRQARMWRRAAWAAGGLAAVVVVAAAALYEREQELYRSTEGALARLARLSPEEHMRVAPLTFDQVAGRLLWGEQDYDRLRRVLIAHQHQMPRDYGVRGMGADNYVPPTIRSNAWEWPFQLLVSPRRKLDNLYFAREWEGFAQKMARVWGLPAPLHFRIGKSDAPRQLIRAIGPGGEEADLEVETYEDLFVITSRDLPGPAASFFNAFTGDWVPLKAMEHGGPWWGVPAWSLPVWKVAGHTATQGSGTTAALLGNALLKSPEPLLSAQTVRLMLDRVAKNHPNTVGEALRARGEQLPNDLAELVRGGTALTNLPMLLDHLAQFPDVTPTEAATLTAEATLSPTGLAPSQFKGPWPEKEKAETEESPNERVYQAFLQVEPWLVSEAPVLRIWVGQNLEAQVFPGGRFSPELWQATRAMRQEIFRTTGIEPPQEWFGWLTDENAGVAPGEYRIELLNQTLENADAKPIAVEGRILDSMIPELRWRLLALQTLFLTPETVAALEFSMDPRQWEWLSGRFSLTDLKLLLRQVVAPNDDELEALRTDPGTAERMAKEGKTLRDIEWLLGSLPFWTEAFDPSDAHALADALRMTQRARLNAPPETGSAIADAIAAGLDALSEFDFATAGEKFASALTADHESSIREFLRQSARLHAEQISRHLRASCEILDRVPFARTHLLPLEDAIAVADAQSAPRLKLCLVASPGAEWARRLQVLDELLRQGAGQPDRWLPPDAAWLGHFLLVQHDPFGGEGERLKIARDLLVGALPRLSEQAAAVVFEKALEHCDNKGALRHCYELLDRLADTSATRDVLLNYARSLSHSEDRGRLERGLVHLASVETLLAKSDLLEAERQRLAESISYFRGMAYMRLSDLGDDQLAARAETEFAQLRGSQVMGKFAHRWLLRLFTDQGRFAEAGALLDIAKRRWPSEQNTSNDVDFEQAEFWLNLARGGDGLSLVATRLSQPSNGRNLFEAAIGEMLTGIDPWHRTTRRFLRSGDQYVNYLAAWLYAFEPQDRRDDALEVLKARIASADVRRWDQRLNEGDAAVWREMLIAYYLGEVSRERLFEPLQGDAAFEASEFRRLPLPRRGMLCEAHFYDALLAKSRGDRDRFIEALDNVIGTGYRGYTEFSAARYLLARERSAAK